MDLNPPLRASVGRNCGRGSRREIRLSLGLLSCNSLFNTARPWISAQSWSVQPLLRLPRLSQSNPATTHRERERKRESQKLKNLFESCVSFSMRGSGKLRLKLDGFIEGEKIKAQQALHLCAYSINSCVYACRHTCMKTCHLCLVEKRKKKSFSAVSVETKNFVRCKAKNAAKRDLFTETAFVFWKCYL